MLPQEDALPRPQGEAPAGDGDRKRRGGERAFDMRGHVVGAFGGVSVERVVFGDEAIEEGFEVSLYRGIRVLLDK